jgi:hypothetical protein
LALKIEKNVHSFNQEIFDIKKNKNVEEKKEEF